MTAYNREKFIEEAIESVLASSYSNFELIIVDDCSIDRTLLIARAFESKDNRIKVYVNETNIGDYPNRNKAAGYAKGVFLMNVDSDDTISRDGIENCINAMNLFPDSGFGIYNPIHGLIPILINSEDVIKNHFFKKPFLFIGPGGTVLKREYFNRINRYPVKYGPANDMYFNIKAACFSPVVLLPFEFMNYRRHPGQEINNTYIYLYNNYLYLKEALNELPLGLTQKEKIWIAKKNKRRFLFNILKYFFKTGDIGKTRHVIKSTQFRFSDAIEAVFQF